MFVNLCESQMLTNNDWPSQYPHLINVIEIGQTYERRPILLAKIGKKNLNVRPYSAKRAIFIEGGKATSGKLGYDELYIVNLFFIAVNSL